MSFKANSSEGTSTQINFIGKGTVIEGSIRTESSLRIDGKVKGTVICKNTLTIGEPGMVEGDIEAQNAVISGQIKGKVIISEKVVLESKSSLIGDLKCRKLIIDEGAVFDGYASMVESSPKSAAVNPVKPENA